VPYSLHSNFVEIEKFVRSICPGILKCVVKAHGKSEKINRIREFSSYVATLQHLKHRGVEFFQKNYIDKNCLSEQYKKYQVKK
jgi:hypothetical protein